MEHWQMDETPPRPGDNERSPTVEAVLDLMNDNTAFNKAFENLKTTLSHSVKQAGKLAALMQFTHEPEAIQTAKKVGKLNKSCKHDAPTTRLYPTSQPISKQRRIK